MKNHNFTLLSRVGQKTKRVHCYCGTAVVNPDYPMKNLAELVLSWEDGIQPGRFAEWYRELRRHASDLVDRPPRLNPQTVRGLRVTIVTRHD